MRLLSILLVGTLFVHHADAFSAVIITGPKGKAAASYEEDLRLTMRIIMDHTSRSTTVSTEQMLSQMAAEAEVVQTKEDVDISIPYDAAAKLAFESSNKSMDYAAFKEKFEAAAVADVAAKRTPVAKVAVVETPPPVVEAVDISIPYDAAAKLAFESSDKSMDYAAFKKKFEADAVADVIAKRTPVVAIVEAPPPVVVAAVDISVPYDAAAKLAFESSDKSMDYAAFKEKFEAAAVAAVVAKRTPAVAVVAMPPPVVKAVDISIPYDAAAKLAFESSNKSMDYAAFKEKFEAAAVADVVAKRTPVPKVVSATVTSTEKDVVAEPPVDIAVPYDAPAKLAYEASDKSMDYGSFKRKFEADAVADVVAKKSPKVEVKVPVHAQTIDVSVPYDAAAKLAYESSDKSSSYEEFRSKYESDAVAAVKAKRQ